MNSSAITFVINGATYRVSAGDSDAIRNIPEADRTELIALLEAVRIQDGISKEAVQSAATRPAGSVKRSQAELAGHSGQHIPKVERLGGGDVDALMARLVMEEKREQKPGLTKQGIYKAVGVFAVIVLLVVVVL